MARRRARRGGLRQWAVSVRVLVRKWNFAIHYDLSRSESESFVSQSNLPSSFRLFPVPVRMEPFSERLHMNPEPSVSRNFSKTSESQISTRACNSNLKIFRLYMFMEVYYYLSWDKKEMCMKSRQAITRSANRTLICLSQRNNVISQQNCETGGRAACQ
jgi:hypothetical protein